MRSFDYKEEWKKLLTPEIVMYLTQIHEFKGEQTLFIEAKADTLSQLVDIAKIQSTEASNKIEGIYTSDERLKALVKDSTRPRTRNEREIAGYRDVLNTIHENHDYIPPKPSIILQLHRDLYKFEGMDIGGRYKTSDNIIEEQDAEGNKSVRFRPMPAWETPEAIEKICQSYDEALNSENIDALIIIPMFVLDFLCVHPFNDGNGRLSRLLTLLLLYRSGYIVGKYISIEKLIEQTKEIYYESLQLSSAGWHENKNDYEPFVKYMLGVIVAAYREFSSRVSLLTTQGMSKPDRVKEIIRATLGPITKTEILAKCPDISQVTVQRALADLVDKGDIIKLGGGRYTKYIWNN
ncbi:Fic family protein [Lachnospira eligens]|jgi:Fic family protein|uniref:Fic family protein n=1 Tax=Lachnospira eligens TaxID=39485 RepID=UPI000E4C9B03|nr:Fic family protein [Lachnospira eligens]RHI68929.1 Fic family protein [Lachnospira eligens]